MWLLESAAAFGRARLCISPVRRAVAFTPARLFAPNSAASATAVSVVLQHTRSLGSTSSVIPTTTIVSADRSQQHAAVAPPTHSRTTLTSSLAGRVPRWPAESSMDLAQFCRSLPKVELHAHLNGSLSMATLTKLQRLRDAESQSSPSSAADLEKACVLSAEPIGTFSECFDYFKAVHRLVDREEALRVATRDVIAEFAEDGVIYLELRTTPRANAATGLTKHDALDTVALAKEFRHRGVVGIDFSGDPTVNNAADFIPALAAARQNGLKTTVHLAEVHRPADTSALLSTRPDRIGHATYLNHAQNSLFWPAPIEVCLTSNVKTGSVARLQDHHLGDILAGQRACVLCTDDKGVFATTLSAEYALAATAFNLSRERLRSMARAAIDYIFEGDAVKAELRARFSRTMPDATSVLSPGLEGTLSNQVSASFHEQVVRWCTAYVGPEWASAGLAATARMAISPMSGGMSNQLYKCERKKTAPDDVDRVLLRLYCGEPTIGTRMTDVLVCCILSERRLGPRIYGVFPEGRLEEFLDGRTMQVAELGERQYSEAIAAGLARFHTAQLPLSKTNNWLQIQLSRSLGRAQATVYKDAAKRARAERILAGDLQREVSWLTDLLESTGDSVVPCHNDLQEGNIMLQPDGAISFIDFEYVGYNYRCYDIANHFCEWAINNLTENFPHFEVDWSMYPDDVSQRIFAHAYLGPDHIGETDKLLKTVEKFVLASNLLWALWAVASGNNAIEWGYLEYAEMRMEAYHKWKTQLLEANNNGN